MGVGIGRIAGVCEGGGSRTAPTDEINRILGGVSSMNHAGNRALPKGWRHGPKLGEVCGVATGSTPPKGEARFYGGMIPWVKPDDLEKSIYVDSSSEYFD